MANVCLMCPPSSSASTMRVINKASGESFRICRPHFVATLNWVDKRTKRGILSAVARQSRVAR